MASSHSDIRAARRAAGLSQAKLAAQANCSVSMLQLLESGYRPAGRSAVLARVLEALRLHGADQSTDRSDADNTSRQELAA